MIRRDIEVRNGFDTFPDPDEGAIECKDENLTRQYEAAHTDINVLMAQYERTGTLPVVQAQALYEDVSGLDYRTMLEQKMQADELFGSLPAKVRNRFENDPVQFLAYFAEPGHEQELVDLGLRVAPAPPAPAPPTP